MMKRIKHWLGRVFGMAQEVCPPGYTIKASLDTVYVPTGYQPEASLQLVSLPSGGSSVMRSCECKCVCKVKP